MTYEQMLIQADKERLIVKEKDIPGYGGRIRGNRIAINRDLRTQAEKSCVLAEELGHYYTSSGDILNQETVKNRKQELRARLWAYDQKIGLIGLIEAYKYGCKNRFEAAEYLDVTEEFLQEAVDCYREKYEISVQIDNYVIIFEPSLIIMRKISFLDDSL
ncbi:MAG: ImmA/IrrE family metallo-endopeptidase [Lachnospiraceae bacterium]|nr:ImmA/IrrE family metallo-endopeptidase [Lachnospiraceae bacterium]